MGSILSNSTIPNNKLASSRFGTVERFHYGDDLQADKGRTNLALWRPAWARLLINRNMGMFSAMVPPYQHTPQPNVENWIPNHPYRTDQVNKIGAPQPTPPGLIDSLVLNNADRIFKATVGSRLGIDSGLHTLTPMGFIITD